MTQTGTRGDIVILDGGRRTPRADILIKNKAPGLFSRFTTTQLGGMAIGATLENTSLDPGLIGHVVMGMAQHSHRDSIYGARGMAWRGGVPETVPALTVARICGSGAEAIAVGAEMITAGMRHDTDRPFMVVGGAESMQYPFCLYNHRGKPVGSGVQKYGPIDVKALPKGTYLQDMLLLSLYDPSGKMAMANTAEELGRRYDITRAPTTCHHRFVVICVARAIPHLRSCRLPTTVSRHAILICSHTPHRPPLPLRLPLLVDSYPLPRL